MLPQIVESRCLGSPRTNSAEITVNLGCCWSPNVDPFLGYVGVIWGCIGIMEKKMGTIILGLGFRV